MLWNKTENKKNSFLIIGTGGHSRVVASILNALQYPVVGFIDINLSTLKNFMHDNTLLALAIGDNKLRKKIAETLQIEFGTEKIKTLIHPSVLIEKDAVIEEMTTLCIGSIICTQARIGKGSLINSGAIIEHECQIGEYAHISPGAKLAGRVKIGALTHIGIGAVIKEKIKIGNNTIVGAGAVVIEDLPDNVIAVGIPAKIIKDNI